MKNGLVHNYFISLSANKISSKAVLNRIIGVNYKTTNEMNYQSTMFS